jgi:3-oxoadipate enol-lactonase
MSLAELKNARLHYDLSGPPELPVLVFSNSLGTNFTMWDAQVAAFSGTFRILRYDTRGHGQSSVTPGPYTIEQLATDLIELLDYLKIPQATFCGLSIGGLTGMWLATHAPERFQKIVLCNTALKIGTVEGWNTRIEIVGKSGVPSIASTGIERWFTPGFRNASPAAVESAKQMLLSTSADGYISCCAAIRDADFSDELATNPIHRPTLIIAGTHDPVTTPGDGRQIADRIPGARYVELDAAHLSNIEAASAFNMAVGRFLAS